MTAPADTWGTDIEVVEVGGVTLRRYVDRPRRVESLLVYANRWGERPHVIQGEHVLTFADLVTKAKAKAASLADEGVKPGQHVMLLGWNNPDWVVNFWGCLALGAVPVLANGWWSESELAAALALAEPTLTLADDACAVKLAPGVRRSPWSSAELDLAAMARALPERSVDEADPAVVLFTSGTEGSPKGVVLSHRSLLAGLHMLLHVSRRLPHQVDESSGDVGLHTGPLFHVGGVQTLLRSVVVGGTIVMPVGKFDAGDAIDLIERHQVTRWSAVPTMVSRVLEHPAVRERDMSSLRSLTVGGAPVHADLLERISAALPSVDLRVPTGYGLTENGGQATAASGAETARRPGSSGRPLPCTELDFLSHGNLADGEILLRSPSQMSGYLGGVESPIDADGWLHTGDLGHLDEDGQLWITGRSKDMIIRGGENIAPVAVERALMTVPGVVEVAVVGVPDDDLGEEVMAFVVCEGRALTSEELRDHLRSSVASFAIPSRWHIQLDPLPTNHTGKIDKSELSARGRRAIEGTP